MERLQRAKTSVSLTKNFVAEALAPLSVQVDNDHLNDPLGSFFDLTPQTLRRSFVEALSYNSGASTTSHSDSSVETSLLGENRASPSDEELGSRILPAAKLKKALSLAGLQVDEDLLDKIHELLGVNQNVGYEIVDYERAVQILRLAWLFSNPQSVNLVNSELTERNISSIAYGPAKAEEEDVSDTWHWLTDTRPQGTEVRWIRIAVSDELSLSRVAIKYRLHPLSLEDVRESMQIMARPKLELYESHLFICVPTITLRGELGLRQGCRLERRFSRQMPSAMSRQSISVRVGNRHSNEISALKNSFTRSFSSSECGTNSGENASDKRRSIEEDASICENFEYYNDTDVERPSTGSGNLRKRNSPPKDKWEKQEKLFQNGSYTNKLKEPLLDTKTHKSDGGGRSDMNSWDSNSHTRYSGSIPEAENDDPIHVGRAFFFLTTNPENTLISVDSPDEELACWDTVRSKILRSHAVMRHHDGRLLLVRILDSLADSFIPVVHSVTEEMWRCRRDVMKEKYRFEEARIERLETAMLVIHGAVKSFTRVVKQLLDTNILGETAKLYLRDVDDTLAETIDEIIFQENLAQRILREHSAFKDDRTSTINFTLTVVATIFLPAQFMTSFYGMNFKYMPELKWKYSYPVFLGVLILVFIVTGTVMVAVRRRRTDRIH